MSGQDKADSLGERVDTEKRKFWLYFKRIPNPLGMCVWLSFTLETGPTTDESVRVLSTRIRVKSLSDSSGFRELADVALEEATAYGSSVSTSDGMIMSAV